MSIATQKKQREVDLFNFKNPVGSPVMVRFDSGQLQQSKVESSAILFCGHTPAVFLKGITGIYELKRVTAIEPGGEA
ncbi:MAG: hypothetical protein JKX85_00565 [Phycisphaeraceae bacterium]|nr:hypothetical protein [Phycisphaeraceae bacterium]